MRPLFLSETGRITFQTVWSGSWSSTEICSWPCVVQHLITSDLPTLDGVTVATYADDIAYLAVDENPEMTKIKSHLIKLG